MKELLQKIRFYFENFPGVLRIFLLRNVEYRFKHWNILRSSPRICMEYRLFPYFYTNNKIQTILLVGVASYTQHYEEYFRRKAAVYTIDVAPEAVKFGIPGHHTADSIENIGKYFEEDTFDCIVMNGVYGYGLNDKAAMARSISNIRRVLKKGGIFLFGWDKVPATDPIYLESKPYFRGLDRFEIAGASRIELDNKHHKIFDIYKKPL